MVELVWRQRWGQRNAPELLDLFFQWSFISAQPNRLLRRYRNGPGEGKCQRAWQVQLQTRFRERHTPGKISCWNVAMAARRRDVDGLEQRRLARIGNHLALYAFSS